MREMFTALNITCGKLMFSQTSVSHSVHGGVALVQGPVCGGGYVQGGTHPLIPPLIPSGSYHKYFHQAGGTHPTGMLSCQYCIVLGSKRMDRQ